uniref:Uncharacterized protein n=1 Tax=Noctiluca scintillans TaxID=2966 RepID=A0A7S1AL04_NOCSC|mmetsp:Transcript_50651/g.134924  ORF Transcript_50651/g.134924 Transcript_50651/m.134924 type:complete len:165 (+) Transcript_50651:52-546(+)|eukprot:CAMPEP_0194485850 /NCGR_PEP_ID=MMETSP0253-20130528/6713_1 /TAXON_ID=2966 /ORGANISM="Noctiluca scintillans" /LENGTH=164 /DNA_ID=CAMNT_0039325871 /DNA_START=57 /DNA_END=551 /DNA_ORIENTATION=-
MSNGDGGPRNAERLANWSAVVEDRLRGAFPRGAASPVVAVPVATLGGLFVFTLIGAASYRRSAKRLARLLPPVPPPAKVVTPANTVPEVQHVVRAQDVLTKGEIVKLFVLPGICAAALLATVGKICCYTLEVNSVEDVARQIRWLWGGKLRPERVGRTGGPESE